MLAATAAIAVAAAVGAADRGVPYPAIPKGKGAQCVLPTDEIRRDHRFLLSHQRDATVRRGVRTTRFSLKECVACHAVPDADGKPVGYEDPRNFCRACHDYTAVRIDCFGCHNSRPDEKGAASPRARP